MTRHNDRGVATRARLVESAQQLFAEQGVTATTPRQILGRSGVGQGSLYHHFPSKRDVTTAAVNRTIEQARDRAESVLGGEGSALDRLESYLRLPRRAVTGCRIGRLTSDPAVMTDEELRESVRSYFAALIDRVAEVIGEDGECLPDDARRRATVVVAAIQGGYVLAAASGDPTPMEDAVEGVIELLATARRGIE